MLGYIPSPSANGVSLGPLRLHMYGFLIVAGVFAAVWLADRRWRARGGEAGTFSAIAVWAVPGGLIGARLYHVVTDYELYTHHFVGIFEIWNGGLGIWGGIAGGALAAWLYVRRHGLDFLAIADAAAPALPLAQAIGRFGNYFNQELFGRPTKLPWGVEINHSIVANLFDGKTVPPAYLHAAAFQPTFLYESLWDLAVVGLVLLIDKRVRLRKGYLFWVYVALYTFGRFFTEYLRIDFAHRILGLRINDWVSVIIFVTAAALVLRRGLVRGPGAEAKVDDGSDPGVDDPDLVPVVVAATEAAPTPHEVIGYSAAAVVADPSRGSAPTSDEPDQPATPHVAPVADVEPVADIEPVAEIEPVADIEPVAHPDPIAQPQPAPEPAAVTAAVPQPTLAPAGTEPLPAPIPAPAPAAVTAAAPLPAPAPPAVTAAAPQPTPVPPAVTAAAPEPTPAEPAPAPAPADPGPATDDPA